MPRLLIWDANEYTDGWLGSVKDHLTVDVAGSASEALELIPDADAFYGRMTPELLAAARKLRWIQATSAGLDGFFFPELRSSEIVITNQRGIFSDIIADHVFGYVLSFARGLHVYRDRQRTGVWEPDGVEVIHLPGQTMGVVGLGGIGLAVAERAHAFGMRVVGLDPAPKGRPAYVEEIYGQGEIVPLLKKSDFVVICIPHTAETEYLLDRQALAKMKPSAILINIGRGKVVELAALTDQLREGALAGAALDVFEEEPLPKGHPLWLMENVLVTPHTAAFSDEILPRREALILENVRRFAAGETLLNVVDHEKGYVVSTEKF